MQDDDAGAAKLVPLRVAARAYGVSKEALRRRVHRGELEHRTDNHGRLLVPLPANVAEEVGADVAPKRQQGGAEEAPTVATLRRALATTREQVIRLEERLSFADELKAELRRQVDQARADLERERQRAEASERRQAEQDRRLDEILRELGELREERRRQEETERRPAERDRQLDEVLRRLDELQEQARRRPWPGLRRWWRRVVEGEG